MHNKDYIGYLLGSIGFVYLISLDISLLISLILAFYISYYVNKSIKDSDKKLELKKIDESFMVSSKGLCRAYKSAAVLIKLINASRPKFVLDIMNN